MKAFEAKHFEAKSMHLTNMHKICYVISFNSPLKQTPLGMFEKGLSNVWQESEYEIVSSICKNYSPCPFKVTLSG